MIGYNRPDKLLARLKELRDILPANVLVSIDFLNEEMNLKMENIMDLQVKTWPVGSQLSFQISEKIGRAHV